MGVLGLTPFLQKNYPHIIHRLPERLKNFTSKRLVIDGTLITQRLHYSPSPHPYRHVLGWYNLAREMNENGIAAVCIFDGEKRSKAKHKELARRQESRRLTASRWNLELLRAKRLKRLKSAMGSVFSLGDEGKSMIAEMLLRLKPRDGTETVGTMDGLHRVGEQLRVLSEEAPLLEEVKDEERFNKAEVPKMLEISLRKDQELLRKDEVTPEEKEVMHEKERLVDEDDEGKSKTSETLTHINARDGTEMERTVDDSHHVEEQLCVRDEEAPPQENQGEKPISEAEVLSRKEHDPLSKVEESPNEDQKLFREDEMAFKEKEASLERDKELVDSTYGLQLRPQDSSFMGLRTLDSAARVCSPKAEDLKSVLLSSYHEFKSSISKVVSLPLPEATPEPEQSLTQSSSLQHESDGQEELVLTKTQCELTLEEGKFWDELTFASTSTITNTPLGTSTFTIDQAVLRSAEDLLDNLKVKSEVVAVSYQRRMDVPTSRTYSESKEILEAMGVLCYEIEEEYEGEALASSLVLNGLADYVVSEDLDVLVYEAPMIRNFSSRNYPLSLVYGRDVRNALDLSKESYIDFTLLLGTDFSQRIKNVGPSRAYKFIKEYGTIENILHSQTKYRPRNSPSEYLAQINSARRIFRSLPPISDRLAFLTLSKDFGRVDEGKVAVIMERCGLGKALVSSAFWFYEGALSGNYFNDSPALNAYS